MKNKFLAILSVFVLFFSFNLQVFADDMEDESDSDEVENNEDSSDDDNTSDDETSAEDAADKIEDATEEIEEAEDTIAEKEDEGSDVSVANESLANAKALLAEAQAAYDSGDYESAKDLAEEAKHEASYARGKDIESDSEESRMGEDFGECVSTKVEDDEDDFEDCFEDFFDSVADHVFESLPESDQEANANIEAAIQELLIGMSEGDLKDLLLAIASYNFSGLDSEDVINEIEDILEDEDNQFDDSEAIDDLEDLFEDLKEDSVESKFENEVIPFKDTDDEEWFFNFVDQLEAEQCVEGFRDSNGNLLGEFRPGNSVLFGESLKFVLKCVLIIDPVAVTENDSWALGYAVKIKLDFEDLLDDELLTKLDDSIEDEDKFNEAMTRAELIALIIDMLNIGVPVADAAPFLDVPLSHDYVNEIAYALSVGMVSGDQETGTFRPDDVPNRAEVAKIIVLAKQLL
jgi:hypothetical protein